MSKPKLTYNNIIDYLKKKLSNTERYNLEKSVMQDAFDEEAFEGLNSLSSDEFEKDFGNLQGKLSNRTRKKGSIVFFKNYRIAASIAILIGVGSLFYFMQPTSQSVDSPFKIVTSPDSELEEINELEFDESKINVDLLKDSISEGVFVIADVEEILEYETETQFKRAKKPLRNESISIPEKTVESIDIIAEQTVSDKSFTEKKSVTEKQLRSGTVTDSKGIPLPGAQIKIVGTNRGVTSDFDGKYTIEATKYDSLAFDYIGFHKAIQPANDSMSIALQENPNILNEIVVVGFGTQKKSDLVGSVTVVESSLSKQKIVSGTVIDEAGAPLPGVSVLVEGTSVGTETDFDGKYTVTIPNVDSLLTFSFIGMINQTIPIQNEILNVVLEEDSPALEEVVIVAYGKHKKKNVVGAISVNYISSIPTAGTIDAFKTWILDQLNKDVFTKNKKYKIQITFTIETNGTLTNIKFGGFERKKIKNEIKSILLKSPYWQPAVNNGVIVNEKREISLDILYQ